MTRLTLWQKNMVLMWKGHELVRNISVGKNKQVEILKNSLQRLQADYFRRTHRCFSTARNGRTFKQLLLLKENGYTIVFISHKIDEVIRICDRVTIMRGGRYMGTYEMEI